MVAILMKPLVWTRALYDWVLRWSDSKHSEVALFFLSMAEASFFPIPPDALLIALCMGAYRKWIRFALICSLGSVIGGAIGYLIGYGAFDIIGEKVIHLTAALSGSDANELLRQAQFWFSEKEVMGVKVGAWAVGIAGFTPIPYKVFTIASGFFGMPFFVFLLASAISRSLRFFIVAGIIGLLYRRFGDRIKTFIDKYFNLLAIAFVILLLLGFWGISFVR